MAHIFYIQQNDRSIILTTNICVFYKFYIILYLYVLLERKEGNNKVNKLQRMCGTNTISWTIKGKTQLSTQIKFYKVMTDPVLM